MLAAVLIDLASVLQETNRLAEAEPLYRRAVTIDEASLGPDHPKVAIDLNNLAGLLGATNRLAEAEPLMQRMAVIFFKFQRDTGHKHPYADADHHNYEVLLSELGHDEAAIRATIEAARNEAGLD